MLVWIFKKHRKKPEKLILPQKCYNSWSLILCINNEKNNNDNLMEVIQCFFDDDYYIKSK